MAESKKLSLNDKVLLCDGDECKLVELRDIRFFETYGNYTKTYFTDGKPLIYRSLNYLESRLSAKHFFRANRQHIVNLSHVKNIRILDNSAFRIEMTCGKKIELSRRRSRLFKGVLSI